MFFSGLEITEVMKKYKHIRTEIAPPWIKARLLKVEIRNQVRESETEALWKPKPLPHSNTMKRFYGMNALPWESNHRKGTDEIISVQRTLDCVMEIDTGSPHHEWYCRRQYWWYDRKIKRSVKIKGSRFWWIRYRFSRRVRYFQVDHALQYATGQLWNIYLETCTEHFHNRKDIQLFFTWRKIHKSHSVSYQSIHRTVTK